MPDHTITLYGIPNCDQVRKARTWLAAHQVEYAFHDFKREGLTAALAGRWLAQAGADTLINRKGTTWRRLADPRKLAAQEPDGALSLMIAETSVIKRPVLDVDGRITVGFSENIYEQIF